MSVATETWLERDFGVPYTLEQIRCLSDAVTAGRTKYPPEQGRRIAEEFGLSGQKKEKWTAEEKDRIRETLGEVGIWPRMAELWLEKIWRKS